MTEPEIDWKKRALKAEDELEKLRNAAWGILGWTFGPECNDCKPTGRYGAGGWEGSGVREDGHEANCGYMESVDKVSVLLDPWLAEKYGKRPLIGR